MNTTSATVAGAATPGPKERHARRFSKTPMIVLAVLVVIGFGCWIYQLIAGLQVTGMSNVSFWGIYIGLFMFFVGLSAGGLIVASSAYVFNVESFKKVAMPAVIISTISICLAGMLVLIDLGGIVRVWRLLTGPNFLSPLIWDIIIIVLYLVINIIDIVWMKKGEERKVAKLSYFALPTAILVHSVTAWIFGLQISRTWYTAIMAPIFVASACDSGLALLLIALVVLEARGLLTTGQALFEKLAKLLAVFVAVDAYFIVCELLTMWYPGGNEGAVLAIMTSGATAPLFWFEIIGGLIIPFVVLVSVKNRQKKGVVVAANILVILGVLFKRLWLLITAFAAPYATNSPTVPVEALKAQAFSAAGAGAFYVPTLVELLIVVGVISLGVLAFMLLCNKLIADRAALE